MLTHSVALRSGISPSGQLSQTSLSLKKLVPSHSGTLMVPYPFEIYQLPPKRVWSSDSSRPLHWTVSVLPHTYHSICHTIWSHRGHIVLFLQGVSHLSSSSRLNNLCNPFMPLVLDVYFHDNNISHCTLLRLSHLFTSSDHWLHCEQGSYPVRHGITQCTVWTPWHTY